MRRAGLVACALLLGLIAERPARAALPWTSDQDARSTYRLRGLLAPASAGEPVTLHFVTPGACVLASTGVDGSVVCGTPLLSVTVTDPVSNTGTAVDPILGVKFTNVSIKLSGGGALEVAGASGGDISSADDSRVLTINSAAVTFPKIQNVAGRSVLGVPGSSATTVSAITSATSGDAFWNNAGTLQWSAYPYSALSGAPMSLPPSGAAGGDLGSTFPNPTVLAAEFGAARLTFSTTPDGALLKRSGTTVAPAVLGTDYVVTVRADGIATGSVQLASVVATNMVDGAIAWVDTVGDYFRLVQAALSTDGITVIAAASKSGYQWHRIGALNRANALVAAWYVDPTSGNDENNGTTSGTALKTFGEFTRRMDRQNISSLTPVNLLSDAPDVDGIRLNVNTTNHSYLEIVGSISVVSTQTVTSAQAKSTSLNRANELTVTSFNWTPFVGSLLRVQGTNRYAPITKAVSLGVGRIGELMDFNTFGVVAGGITTGQIVEIISQPKGPLELYNGGNAPLFVSDVRFSGTGTVVFTDMAPNSTIMFRDIFLSTTGSNVSSLTGLSTICNVFGNASIGTTGFLNFSGGAFIGKGLSTSNLNLNNVRSVNLISFVTEAGHIEMPGSNVVIRGDFGQFDVPTSGLGPAGVYIPDDLGPSQLYFDQVVGTGGVHYGSGNTGTYAWYVTPNSVVNYNSASPPTYDGGHVWVNGASHPYSDLPIPISPFTSSGAVNSTGAPADGSCTNCSVTVKNNVVTAYSSGSAGIPTPGSNGILVWTGSATASRTLINSDGTINFTNADGVAGNPEIHVNAIPESKVTNLVTDLSNLVPKTRTLTMSSFLSCGGGSSCDLSTDRTIAFVPPTGTGFPHIASGVMDAAARAIDLSTADVTNLLPAAKVAPSGTNSWVLTTVGGVAVWQAPAAPGTGTVTNVSGVPGDINVASGTSTPLLSLPNVGPGAGPIGGSGIAGLILDHAGRVAGVATATYLTSAGTTPGTYNNITDAASGLIIGASVTSWMTAGYVMVSGGPAALPTGDPLLTYDPVTTHTMTLGGAVPISLNASGTQNFSKSNGDLGILTTGFNAINIATASAVRFTIDGSGNTFISALASGGLTYSAPSTGQIAPAAIAANTGLGFSSGTLSGVVFGAVGGSHAQGMAPDPGTSCGSTFLPCFLRDDATWASIGAANFLINQHDGLQAVLTVDGTVDNVLFLDSSDNIHGADPGSVDIKATLHYYVQSINPGGNWFETSSATAVSGSSVEYPVEFAATKVRILANISTNTLSGCTSQNYRTTRNTAFRGPSITVPCGTAGIFDSGYISAGSTSTIDVWGLFDQNNGGGATGGIVGTFSVMIR